jgi:hypothetical protein
VRNRFSYRMVNFRMTLSRDQLQYITEHLYAKHFAKCLICSHNFDGVPKWDVTTIEFSNYQKPLTSEDISNPKDMRAIKMSCPECNHAYIFSGAKISAIIDSN